MDRFNAHLSLSLPLVPAGSEWNARWQRKLMTQTLRLAAKTAMEYPSENFVALIGDATNLWEVEWKKKMAAKLIMMGVSTDQIVS